MPEGFEALEQEQGPWYEAVDHDTPLTQGDLILDCPLLGWKREPVELKRSEDAALKRAWDCYRADVVVMTQACDLEQENVRNIILCSAFPLSRFKALWAAQVKATGKNPNEDRWRSFCDSVSKGFRWNMAILNVGIANSLETEHRIVDFTQVHTAPRSFIESLLEQRAAKRLRLLPPYREHLSQAFARFFMRVGLPTPVEPIPVAIPEGTS